MWVSLLYTVVALFIARDLATYNPSLAFTSYFELKNKAASILLLKRRKQNKSSRLKSETPKITLVGIFAYCFIAFALIVALLVLFVIPETPCESFDSGKYALYGDSYNEQFTANLVGSVLSAEVGLLLINTMNNGPSVPKLQRTNKIAYIVLGIILFILSIATGVKAVGLLKYLF